MASSCPATDAARTVIAQKESLKSLTIDAADRLQYVSQLVDVKHNGASAIGERRNATNGTCLAFAWLRIGGESMAAHAPQFAVHEDTSS